MVQIPLDEMNPALIDAVILTEDVRFREHHGIDLTSILRAVKANWRAGRYVQGGSTIPQQLIKMTMLSPEKKMTRKILEASMAVAADLIYSKDTILKSYLNRVYLGHVGARPVQGVGEASRLYFAKKCSDLSVEECAMIAGMIKAPNVINPIKRPARARKRRNMILGLLRDAGKISEPEYIRAANSLVSMRNPELISVKAKAFMDLIKARASEFGELKEKISKARVLSTTIDPLEQEKSNKVYRSLITDGQKGRIIRIDTVNGQIKAYAGSLKWSGAGGALDTISPFLALAALSPENGAPPRYTLTTPFYPSKAPRKPVTFTKAFHVHRKQLLDKLISGLGVARISRVLENCNIPFRVTNGRIELQPMTPMELACKYSVFPGLGRGVKPHFLITAESGPNFSGSQSGFKVPVQSSVIFLVNRLLKPYSLIQKRHGLSTGLWKAPSIIVSKESNGVWGIAYWHENLTLVRFSDTTLPLESVSAALEKLNPKPKHYVHKRYPPPNGLLFRKVCLESGLRATSLCARVVAAPFLKGTQPSEWCPLTKHESGP
jgi:penicillin-binding protein 1B